MVSYETIREDTPDGQRTLRNLVDLRRTLRTSIPPRSDEMLLLATWNIREFDSNAYGARTNEPLQYIAEIVNRFDIIAITEVRSNLRALDRLMGLLGPGWDYIVTDTTAGTAGNRERLAIVFDTHTVSFGGLAGELVLPPVETTDADGNKVTVPAAQFARTPLLAGFRSKWVDFMLAVFHVIWGENEDMRAEEMSQLSRALIDKADDTNSWSSNFIVLGDFNIGSPTDLAWKELRSKGWTIPPDFVTDIRGTNIAQSKFYDQIAIRPRPGLFELASPRDHPAAGAFNFFDCVYRPRADFDTYRDTMAAYRPDRKRSNFTHDSNGRERSKESQERWYRNFWRTHQMSDHLPLWVAIRTDYTDPHLESRIT